MKCVLLLTVRRTLLLTSIILSLLPATDEVEEVDLDETDDSEQFEDEGYAM